MLLSVQSAFYRAFADVLVVSELLAFAAVVDWAGSSVLYGFEEGGEEVKSFVDNSLSSLCVVHCNDNGGVGFAVSLSGRGFIYLFIYCSYCMQPKEAMADEEKPS